MTVAVAEVQIVEEYVNPFGTFRLDEYEPVSYTAGSEHVIPDRNRTATHSRHGSGLRGSVHDVEVTLQSLVAQVQPGPRIEQISARNAEVVAGAWTCRRRPRHAECRRMLTMLSEGKAR
jgi:hypothetical protein